MKLAVWIVAALSSGALTVQAVSPLLAERQTTSVHKHEPERDSLVLATNHRILVIYKGSISKSGYRIELFKEKNFRKIIRDKIYREGEWMIRDMTSYVKGKETGKKSYFQARGRRYPHCIVLRSIPPSDTAGDLAYFVAATRYVRRTVKGGPPGKMMETFRIIVKEGRGSPTDISRHREVRLGIGRREVDEKKGYFSIPILENLSQAHWHHFTYAIVAGQGLLPKQIGLTSEGNRIAIKRGIPGGVYRWEVHAIPRKAYRERYGSEALTRHFILGVRLDARKSSKLGFYKDAFSNEMEIPILAEIPLEMRKHFTYKEAKAMPEQVELKGGAIILGEKILPGYYKLKLQARANPEYENAFGSKAYTRVYELTIRPSTYRQIVHKWSETEVKKRDKPIRFPVLDRMSSQERRQFHYRLTGEPFDKIKLLGKSGEIEVSKETFFGRYVVAVEAITSDRQAHRYGWIPYRRVIEVVVKPDADRTVEVYRHRQEISRRDVEVDIIKGDADWNIPAEDFEFEMVSNFSGIELMEDEGRLRITSRVKDIENRNDLCFFVRVRPLEKHREKYGIGEFIQTVYVRLVGDGEALAILKNEGDGYKRVYGTGDRKIGLIYYYEKEELLHISQDGYEAVQNILERMGLAFDESNPYSMWNITYFADKKSYFDVYIKKLPPTSSQDKSLNQARQAILNDTVAIDIRGKRQMGKSFFGISESAASNKKGFAIYKASMASLNRRLSERGPIAYTTVLVHEWLGHLFARLKDEYNEEKKLGELIYGHNIAIDMKAAIQKWGDIPGFDADRIDAEINELYSEEEKYRFYYHYKGHPFLEGENLMRGTSRIIARVDSPQDWKELLSLVEKSYFDRAFERLGVDPVLLPYLPRKKEEDRMERGADDESERTKAVTLEETSSSKNDRTSEQDEKNKKRDK